MAEYLVVAGAVALLFTVIVTTDADLLAQVLSAVSTFFRRFSFALSLPT